MAELTYDDFKNKLSIQDVLIDAGYTLNRRDGLRYPSYVRLDSEGRRIRGDKFIVTANGLCCFLPPTRKNYNVISFIKEHPEMFSDYTAGMDKDRLVNLVCNRLLNNPIEEREKKIINPQRDLPPFKIDDYKLHRFDGNDRETQKPFYPYFQPKLADVSGGSNGKRNIKLSLPEQSPSFDSKLHLPLLVGLWDDDSESFTMVNPLLVVRLNLSLADGEQEVKLKRVSIAGNNDEILWGSSAVLSTSDMGLTFNEEGATTSFSLDCGDEILGADGKTISFCIPAKQYQKGLRLKLFCLEGVFTADIKPEGIDLPNDSVLEQNLSVKITKSKLFVDVVRKQIQQ